ncbi:hypothetical protein NKH57_12715 [Mesorhizobium sp. M1050]|uniref:hypothetical protein n=1 Tax=unclassified Mesorhizobium TaxID=325217 RepID=UPI000400A6CC
MPAPTWKPEPIEEPEPEGLPDETPLPNPDENEEPPVQATSVRKRETASRSKRTIDDNRVRLVLGV